MSFKLTITLSVDDCHAVEAPIRASQFLVLDSLWGQAQSHMAPALLATAGASAAEYQFAAMMAAVPEDQRSAVLSTLAAMAGNPLVRGEGNIP